MKFTNKYHLSEPLVKALKHNDYSAGDSDYTPSSLIRPPYMTKLLKKFNEKLVIDVSDRFFILEGNVVHHIIEQFADNNNLVEKRLYAKVGKWKIGAQLDNLVLDAGILGDYKNTTHFKFQRDFGGRLPEVPDWEAQLNILSYVIRNNKYNVNKLEIVGLLKDFSKSQAKYTKGYPKAPIVKRDIQIWSDEKIEEYITTRAMLHDSENPAPCSDEEMWAMPAVYALKKKGRKSAVKLFPNESELMSHATNKKWVNTDSMDTDHNPIIKLNKEYSIEFRPGKRNRCEGYCTVGICGLCPVHEKFIKENK